MLFGKHVETFPIHSFPKTIAPPEIEHILSRWKDLQVVAGE